MKWLRVRFRCANVEDPRPITFPPPGPYWISGEGEGYAIVIAFVREEAQIYAFWPDASHLDAEERDVITFTGRFPRPDWWTQ